MRIIFPPALRAGWITINPMQWLEKPSKETSRDRVLNDEEVKTLWKLLDNESENAR